MAVSGVQNTDFDKFLFLLTTQLKNQDPLSPMDSNEFTNQLVQFSQVEQTIKTNESLEKLLAMNKNSLGVSALGYLGRVVQVASSNFPLQNGASKFAYYMPEEAGQATVTISDSAGNIVHTITGELEAGRHVFEWDGIGADGIQLPDGVYKLTVTAFNKDGSQIQVTPIAFGTATGVASDDEGVAIALGDIVVPLENVLAVHTE